MPEVLAIIEALSGPLEALITEELADGQKSSEEATRNALRRLADSDELRATLPTVTALFDAADKPKAERG